MGCVHDAHALPGTDHLVDRLRLHVVAHGPARTGSPHPPLLLLHGLGTSSYLWHDVMRDLAHGGPSDRRSPAHPLATIAPDLVNLGRSEHSARRVTLADQARLLLELLDQLEVNRVVVAGHGLGGTVAVHLAALAADRIAGLVLLSTPVHPEMWPPAAVVPWQVPGVKAALAAGLRRSPKLARAVLARSLTTTFDSFSPREVDAYLAPLVRPDGVRSLLAFVDAVDLEPTRAAWDIVRTQPPPSLVLWGTADHVFSPGYGRRLAADLPGSAWVPIAAAGHLLPHERPERCAEELAGFIAELAEESKVS
jgi:pimeloyl-ACP methyl ester carboxylesterase